MYHCSHTAHICIHDDKLVTRYKDVSEHNRDCNGNSSALRMFISGVGGTGKSFLIEAIRAFLASI